MGVGVSQIGVPATVARHWVIVGLTLLASLAAGVFYCRKATPLYTSTSRVHIQPMRPRMIGDLEPNPGSEEAASILNTQRAVLSSNAVLSAALKSDKLKGLQTLAGESDPLLFLQKKLKVGVGRKDNIVVVELDSAYPEEAATIVNAVVVAYTAYQAQECQAVAKEMLDVLQQAKAECDKEMQAKRGKMLELRHSAGTLAMDEANSPALRTLQSLRDAITTARMEAITAEATYAEAIAAYKGNPEQIKRVEELEKTGGIVISTESENTSLRSSMAENEQKIDELQRLNNWGPGHPQIKGLQGRLEYLRALYVVATKRRVTIAQAKLAGLESAAREQQAQAQQIAVKGAEYALFDTELKRLEKQSDAVEERIRQVKTDARTGAMNIRVLEEAVAGVIPSWPRKLHIYGMAGLGGLVLGAFLACLREWARRRVDSPDEAREALGVPLVGTIPHIRRARGAAAGQVVRADPLSDVAESHRAILAALRPLERDGRAMKILLTSVTGGEGKSTITGNLAIVLAQSGRRVLVVDADFHKPCQHKIFRVSSDHGLPSALAGDAAIDQVIQRTEIEGVDVLPGKPVSVAPSELLASRRFAEVLEKLAGRYDAILIDSQPMDSHSDARMIASLCDAALLVVRMGRTDRAMAARACGGLASLDSLAVGLVANDARRKRGRILGCCETLSPAAGGSSAGAARSQPDRTIEPVRWIRPSIAASQAD